MRRILLTLILTAFGMTFANNDLYIVSRSPYTGLDTTIVRITDLSSITMGQVPTAGLIAYYPLNAFSTAADFLTETSGNNRTAQMVKGTANSVYGAADRFGNMYKAIAFFSDSAQYLKVPNCIDGLSALSISAWFYPDSTNPWRWIFAQSPNPNFVQVGAAINNSVLRYHFTTGGSGSATHITDGKIPVTIKQWNHVVVTYDGTTFKSYVNNLADTTMAITGTVYAPDSTTIGCGYYGGNKELFSGYIDDVRYYNRPLTAAEVNALYLEGGYIPK